LRAEWQWLRTLCGLVIAPGAPAVVLVHAYPGSDGAALFGVIFAISAYVAALVFGLPLHLLLERHSVRGFVAYALVGCILGVCAAFLAYGAWALLDWGRYPQHAAKLLGGSWRMALAAGVYGLATGSLFWFVAIWRRSPTT
jgi:hypothetical protein